MRQRSYTSLDLTAVPFAVGSCVMLACGSSGSCHDHGMLCVVKVMCTDKVSDGAEPYSMARPVALP